MNTCKNVAAAASVALYRCLSDECLFLHSHALLALAPILRLSSCVVLC